MLILLPDHPAGHELCHQVSDSEVLNFCMGLMIFRSGIAITSSYAIRQCSRLLEVSFI